MKKNFNRIFLICTILFSLVLVDSLLAGQKPRNPRELTLAKLQDKEANLDWSEVAPQATWNELSKLYSLAKKDKTLFTLVLEKNPQPSTDFLKSFYQIVFCLDGVDADAASGLFFKLFREKPTVVLKNLNDEFLYLNDSREHDKTVCLGRADTTFHQDAFEVFARLIAHAPAELAPSKSPSIKERQADYETWKNKLILANSPDYRHMEGITEVIDKNIGDIFQ